MHRSTRKFAGCDQSNQLDYNGHCDGLSPHSPGGAKLPSARMTRRTSNLI
jgi:hypothetical protein